MLAYLVLSYLILAHLTLSSIRLSNRFLSYLIASQLIFSYLSNTGVRKPCLGEHARIDFGNTALNAPRTVYVNRFGPQSGVRKPCWGSKAYWRRASRTQYTNGSRKPQTN